MASSAIRMEIDAARLQFRWESQGLSVLLNDDVAKNLVRRAIRVEAAAKRNATNRPGPMVRTGRLRGSITWRLGRDHGFGQMAGPYVDVGTAVSYACVFGGHTTVTTDKGQRAICQVEPGERVLTQAGDFQQIIAKTAFPAIEKPDIVTLSVPWRSDRRHRLTLTLDHKVLCHREGRNQWICAGDLVEGDLLYDRRKLAHNKDTGSIKTCEWCKNRHRGQGRRYCSLACRTAAWNAGANPHLGAVRSDATRKLLRDANIARGAGVAMNRKLAERGHRTSHERDVEKWLIERGEVYEMQVPFGGHVVDFFLPVSRQIIEADGAYWHQDQGRDIERDSELLEAAPGVEITHLHFFDKRFSPPLEAEPLPGVTYVACNPGPESFADPDQFRTVPVAIERQWEYGVSLNRHASARALLYDLSIEGVHSFLASGVIVSNSFVELGTKNAPAYPFLRPALEAAREA